jgi:hypothetical protein
MIATWITAKRERIPLGAMTTSHVYNCIRAIQQGRISRGRCDGFNHSEWVLIFQAELTRRNRLGTL